MLSAVAGGPSASLGDYGMRSRILTSIPNPVSQLIFHVQPSNVATNTNISPAVVVYAADGMGSPVAGFTGNITMSVHSGTGTLSGTLVIPCVAGVATFSDLQLDTAGAFTLHATDGTHTVDSASFDVLPTFVWRGQNTYKTTGTVSGVGPAYLPQDLAANPVLFQDVARTTAALLAADPVGSLYDSADSLAAEQATAGKRPLLQYAASTDGFARPFLAVDGSDDFLTKASVPFPVGNAPWSAFFALTRTNDNVFFSWGKQADGSLASAAFYFPSGNISVLGYDVLMSGPFIALNTPIVVSITYDGTTLGAGLKMWINGVQQSLSGSGGAFAITNPPDFAIGRWANFDGLYYGGNMYFSGVIAGVVSAGARAAVETYITGLLPTHALTPINIGFIGDSITAGSGPTTAADQPVPYEQAQLRQGVRTIVGINSGSSNTQSSDWVSGSTLLNAAISAYTSAGVTKVQVMLGINDAANSVLVGTYIANMTSQFNALVAAGFQVIISQPTAASNALFPAINTLLSTYLAPLAALANGTTIVLGDQTAYSVFFAHPEYLADGIHPNDTGGQVLGGLWQAAFPLPW